MSGTCGSTSDRSCLRGSGGSLPAERPVVLERLGGLAVATVAAVPAIGGMLLVAEMIGELGFQDPLGHALLHALEQAVFAEEVLGVHPVFHKLIQKTVDLT